MSQEGTQPQSDEPVSTGITYFSLLRLRHREKGFLASIDAHYSHDGSTQQQVVGCLPIPTEDTWWMIRPYNGGDFDKKATDRVQVGEVVRFQHVTTGRNLHSHPFPAPCSGQQEVSALGEDGVGNHDDDWIVETREDSEVNTGATFLFKHVTTGYYLHSHDDRHFTARDVEFQEVTAYDDDDENNDWHVAELKSPERPPTLQPFIALDAGITHIQLNTARELKGWLESEKAAYGWLLSRPSNAPGHFAVRDYVDNQFADVATTLGRLLSPAGNSIAEDIRTTITSQLSALYSENLLLDSRDSRFKWLHEKAKADPASASHALAYFLEQEPEFDSPHAIKGAFSAFAFENGFTERAKTEAETLDDLKRQFGRDTENQKAQHSQIQAGIDAKFAETERLLKSKEHEFNTLFQKNREQLDGIIKAAEIHAATKDSVTYWQQKAKRHLLATIAFGVAALLAGASVVWALLSLAIHPDFFQQTTSPIPDWQRVSVTLIVGTFGIWLVRVLVQLLYSNFHLMSDARERAVMVEVYISLLRNNQTPLESEHKLLILQSLFRPAPSGVVKDDGSPSTLLNAVAAKLIK